MLIALTAFPSCPCRRE